jgi:integrase
MYIPSVVASTPQDGNIKVMTQVCRHTSPGIVASGRKRIFTGASKGMGAVGPVVPPGRTLRSHRSLDRDELRGKLDEFYDICTVDLQLKHSTSMKHQREVTQFLMWLDKPEITKQEVRAYLKTIEGVKYEHVINALRRFFRDFLEQEDLIKGIKLPYRAFRPNRIPTKNDLIRLYEFLPDTKARAFFLLLASSGLRTSEALSLQHKDIDLDKRLIIPKTRSSTKHTWVSFYNIETEQVLQEYAGN